MSVAIHFNGAHKSNLSLCRHHRIHGYEGFLIFNSSDVSQKVTKSHFPFEGEFLQFLRCYHVSLNALNLLTKPEKIPIIIMLCVVGCVWNKNGGDR